MLKLNPRLKTRIGGALGLALLAAAFAYRWIGPERLGLERGPRADTASLALEPALPAPQPATPVLPPRPAAVPATAAPAVGEVDDEGSLAAVSAEVQAEVDDALARGDAARDADKLTAPERDNALYWYEAALEVDPRNAAAAAARRGVLDALIEAAHAALDEGDSSAANSIMALLAERKDTASAREALLARVQNLPRVQFLLREGAQRMALGQRFEPESASALASYRAVAALDPRNLAARQGLARIEAIVLEQALDAASDDQFADSDRLLALATTILTGTEAQLETRARILELKRQRTDALLARAVAALDARNPDSAQALLARAESLGVDAALLDPLRERIANARLYEHRAPGETFADPFLDRAGSGPDLVVLPVGTLKLGSPAKERGRKDNEGPQHEVTVARAFALGRTEVTVADFARFVRETDYRTDAERIGSSTVYDEGSGRMRAIPGATWRRDYLGGAAGETLPVVHVSWNDAATYVQWLAERTGRRYRLPSEAEFEYALRAGAATRYPWGDANPARVLGNFTGDGDRSSSGRSWTRSFPRYSDGHWGPAPAASFAPNPYGLFDLAGNVSEWVEDCWHDSYLRAPADGTAWVNPGCGRRVIRGAAWGSAPDQVRSAFRLNAAPDNRSARVGFRVARDL